MTPEDAARELRDETLQAMLAMRLSLREIELDQPGTAAAATAAETIAHLRAEMVRIQRIVEGLEGDIDPRVRVEQEMLLPG